MSSTLYIGNLSFYTTEEQIYELFSRAGEVRRIVMGLDRYNRTPCGFCFVEYYSPPLQFQQFCFLFTFLLLIKYIYSVHTVYMFVNVLYIYIYNFTSF